jgi:signal transduction histidine kinase
MEFGGDGRRRYIKISGVPYDDGHGIFCGYRGTGSDITAEREQEAHARLVEERFMQALENINEGFAIYGPDERLIACNQRYQRMHWRNGRDPGSEPVRLGMSIREIYMLRARNGLYEVPPGQGIEEFADTKRANYRAFRDHWYWQTADGRWLHISQTRTKDGGSVSVWTDLTDLKAAETERRKFEERLQHSQKLESLGTLAGGVAHDLNNILVPVMALTKMTAADLPTHSKGRKNLLRVMQASERARDLVRQILAFSRKDEPTKQRLDLEEIVHEALRMLRASIPATIRIDEQIEPVAQLYGDPVQLHQIIVNLVTNAAHAIGARTGVLAVGLHAIPALEGELEQILLTVRDTGCGMDELTRARLRPFLHHQARGRGYGPGVVDRSWDRRRAWRTHRGEQPSWRGQRVSHHPAAGSRRWRCVDRSLAVSLGAFLRTGLGPDTDGRALMGRRAAAIIARARKGRRGTAWIFSSPRSSARCRKRRATSPSANSARMPRAGTRSACFPSTRCARRPRWALPRSVGARMSAVPA